MHHLDGAWRDDKNDITWNSAGNSSLYVGVVEAIEPSNVYIVQGPIVNPDNGHTYYRLSHSSWKEAEAFAVDILGGNLVRINDELENTFVYNNFVAEGGPVWIGLNDEASEGTFTYSNGEPVGYVNWGEAEPSAISVDEDFVSLDASGAWSDNRDNTGNIAGVVEVGVQMSNEN